MTGTAREAIFLERRHFVSRLERTVSRRIPHSSTHLRRVVMRRPRASPRLRAAAGTTAVAMRLGVAVAVPLRSLALPLRWILG